MLGRCLLVQSERCGRGLAYTNVILINSWEVVWNPSIPLSPAPVGVQGLTVCGVCGVCGVWAGPARCWGRPEPITAPARPNLHGWPASAERKKAGISMLAKEVKMISFTELSPCVCVRGVGPHRTARLSLGHTGLSAWFSSFLTFASPQYWSAGQCQDEAFFPYILATMLRGWQG